MKIFQEIHSQPMKMMLGFLTYCVLCIACVGQVPDKNEWGEKFNSTGAKLLLKESGRSRINGQTIISYRLFASGLVKDTDYSLWIRLAGSDPRETADAFINKEGLVVSVLADPTRKIDEDPINLRVVAGRGEPKQFALISKDGRYRAYAQAIPFPIENTVGPCHMSASMLAPNYSAVRIVVTGLQPKEEFQINTQSGTEGSQVKATATEQGGYDSVVFPTVKGQRSGNARFNLTAKSCNIGIEFPWGESSYKIQ